MIISDQFKFIFVHIPKTGGTSVRRALRIASPQSQHPLAETRTKHEPLLTLMSRVSENEAAQLNQYYKFAFVRNPWDRVVSLHAYLLKKETQFPINDFRSLDTFINGLYTGISWIRNLHSSKRQIEFIVNDQAQISVDFLGRFENLTTDFRFVTNKLGLKARLPHLNRSDHADYRRVLSKISRQQIAEYYRTDIETFGYSFD